MKGPGAPVRRGQLIIPFGVGAMINAPGGASLVVAGLDKWFDNLDNRGAKTAEYRVVEHRLARLLGVDHFRLPPDYREARTGAVAIPNSNISVPAYRFPKWHFCHFCKALVKHSPYAIGSRGKLICEECKATKKKSRPLAQVPFVAICTDGHLSEFPWREWVHKTVSPNCSGALRISSTGSAMLEGQIVSCDGCGRKRPLSGIMYANNETTTLSSTLSENGEIFYCPGERPWFGDAATEKCEVHVRGSLRSASNVYFGEVKSSIYLPYSEVPEAQELAEKLLSTSLFDIIRELFKQGNSDDGIVKIISGLGNPLLEGQSAQQLLAMLAFIREWDETLEEKVTVDEQEQAYKNLRIEEFKVLGEAIEAKDLKIKSSRTDKAGRTIDNYFSKIMLVEKLRETRVLAGFSRVFPEPPKSVEEKKQLLWNDQNKIATWLPANVVYGEGIFLEFNENLVAAWEQQEIVKRRIVNLIQRYQIAARNRRLRPKEMGARFLLVHTLAHLLINTLTFECGYSSAALRERLYVSDDPKNPMAGLLIYTADGDTEGSLGGLVRMGHLASLERIFLRAIESAKWCSVDPVCMEIGSHSGQGPESCNLAACHNCVLLPETACEEFNRFLDRGLLIGDHRNESLGFFDAI